jgi:Major Facilitator Superfamily.
MFYIYYLIVYFGLGVLMTFLSVFFRAETPLEPSQITMMMSFVPLVSFVSQNFFAYLSDKTQKYKTVLMAVMLTTVVTCLMLSFGAKADQIFVVIGLYFLFAFFYPAHGVLTENFTLQYAKNTHKPYGRIRLFGSAGYAIAGQVAGFITDQFGLTIIFYIYAICIFIPMLFVPKFPEIEASKKEQTEEEHHKNEGIYKQLFANKKFVLIMCCSFLILGTMQVTNTFFGLYITEYANLSLTFLGTTTLISAGTEIPMMFFSNKLIDKFGVYKILALGAILNSLRFLVYFLFPHNVVAIILVTCTHGVGYGAAYTAMMHVINETVPTHMRATAISLNTSLAIGVGAFAITFLGSFIFNPRTIYICLATFEILGFLVCLYLLTSSTRRAKRKSV